MGVLPRVWALLTDWRHYPLLATLVLLGDALLGAAIILTTKCEPQRPSSLR